ncbi:MAG TPA: class I SAM-dependent methyltransferase [Candidatus Binataceae bacterium]|nr:class I SAM-dependent methyltransferase [Candidatus Binataceae bacterium]
MAASSPIIDPARGAAFDDEDVARCYLQRPPYPPELYEFLLSIVAARGRALDLGCGPGKIARELARHFALVDAVDPSAPMLKLGKRLEADRHSNINWIEATAEAAALDGRYDLITAGASVHWMRHEAVFPKIAAHLAAGGVVAIMDGDGAHEPPWSAAWREFMIKWLAVMDRRTYDKPGFDAALHAFERWMDVGGRRSFTFEFAQSVQGFVECQHSRATWTHARMGLERAATYDRELRALLLPHASDGVLRYQVSLRLTWGTARTSPREL